MTGKERVTTVLSGEPVADPPVLPIIHTALARIADVSLGKYFNDSSAMAEVAISSAERFGLDGVQLTLGVVAEPEALGARVEKPLEGAPILKEHLLSDLSRLDDLRGRSVSQGGRLPMYQDAVAKVVRKVGDRVFVISTLRGPLNIAAQLRGVEQILVDMIEQPEVALRILEFTTEVAVRVSQASLESGAHALMFGEATCSPNFISPAMYRRFVQPLHTQLMGRVKEMGWGHAGLHVCGNIKPILEDLIATGAGLLDVDYQVDAAEAATLAYGRVALRGNLDPSSLFYLGTPDQVFIKTAALCEEVSDARWILSSGCDIPPGTPAENIEAFVKAARQGETTR
jgi:uroporphyrinogen decarboxylase